MNNCRKLSVLLLTLLWTAALWGRTVYITRHGQIGDSGFRSFNGEYALTPLGSEQAKLLGNYLKGKKFCGTIYASPLFRTMQTAELIGKINNLGFSVDPGLQEYAPVLQEKNQGRYGICAEGCTGDDIKKYFPAAKISARFTFPWRLMNEPEKMRHERSERTLNAILAETSGDILLVGHSATAKSLMVVLSKWAGKTIYTVPWNCFLITVTLNEKNQVTGYSVETENFLKPEQVTNNFRKPLVPKVNDRRYRLE